MKICKVSAALFPETLLELCSWIPHGDFCYGPIFPILLAASSKPHETKLLAPPLEWFMRNLNVHYFSSLSEAISFSSFTLTATVNNYSFTWVNYFAIMSYARIAQQNLFFARSMQSTYSHLVHEQWQATTEQHQML